MNIKKEYERTCSGDSRGMPPKPKFNMDEDGEEVTRKIAPAMVMPSLGPLPTMPASITSPPTFNTSVMKSVKPLVSPSQEHFSDMRSVPLTWELHSVSVLPESYSLERTATFVPNANPEEVASRIIDVLRERSIGAKYEKGKAKVKCATSEGVSFGIHLFRGRGRFSHGIIVEVQRFFGTSYVFHSDTQAILKGAEGMISGPPALCMPSRSNNLPEVSDDDGDGIYPVSSTVSPLEMVGKMMSNASFGSQHLGLQMLQPLVISERLSLSTAQAVAARLFEPGCEVGKKVINYVAKNSSKKKTKPGVFDDDDDDDFDILRNLSLGILANAIIVHGRVSEHVRDTLMPALLRDLHDAENHPNNAFQAAKCLEHLIQEDYNAELDNALKAAHKVGEARHANLMHQAKKCIGIGYKIHR